MKKKVGKEMEAQIELAKAMNRLAEGIEKFTDPVYIQKMVGDAMQSLAGTPLAPQIAQALPVGVRLESITISLSDDEREKMAESVYKALIPQLKEFGDYVHESLKELPAHRLKELATQIEAGAKPKIQRRHGCIFVVLDSGYESHLPL